MGLRSTVGLEATDLGERLSEMRVLCRREGESVADLVTPPLLLSLLTFGVAGDTLLFGVVSEKPLDRFGVYIMAERKCIRLNPNH